MFNGIVSILNEEELFPTRVIEITFDVNIDALKHIFDVHLYFCYVNYREFTLSQAHDDICCQLI